MFGPKDNALTSLSWLANMRPSIAGLDSKDEPGRRCRRSWNRTHKSNKGSSPYAAKYANLPRYWSAGGTQEFTEAGEELDIARPAFSFTCLIGLAILTNACEKLSVGKIYAYIQRNFPYFREAKSTWRNSVRHVLSLGKFFSKSRTSPTTGNAADGKGGLKGGLWGVKPGLYEALFALIEEGQRSLPAALIKHLGISQLRTMCANKRAAIAATRKQQQTSNTACAGPAVPTAADVNILETLAVLTESGSSCDSPTDTVPDCASSDIFSDSCASFNSLFEVELPTMDGMLSDSSYDEALEDGWSSSDDAQGDMPALTTANVNYMNTLTSVEWPVHPQDDQLIMDIFCEVTPGSSTRLWDF